MKGVLLNIQWGNYEWRSARYTSSFNPLKNRAPFVNYHIASDKIILFCLSFLSFSKSKRYRCVGKLRLLSDWSNLVQSQNCKILLTTRNVHAQGNFNNLISLMTIWRWTAELSTTVQFVHQVHNGCIIYTYFAMIIRLYILTKYVWFCFIAELVAPKMPNAKETNECRS